jgi:hypothetical protein
MNTNIKITTINKANKSKSTTVSAKVNDYRKVRNRSHLYKYLPILIRIIVLKNTKPLMEKRRRERINRSLEELKNLILDQTSQTVSVINF